MNTKEYQATVKHVALMAQLLAGLDIPAILAAIDRAGAIGPILDPTLYREKNQAMEEDAELLRAAIPLRTFGKRFATTKESANAKINV